MKKKYRASMEGQKLFIDFTLHHSFCKRACFTMNMIPLFLSLPSSSTFYSATHLLDNGKYHIILLRLVKFLNSHKVITTHQQMKFFCSLKKNWELDICFVCA